MLLADLSFPGTWKQLSATEDEAVDLTIVLPTGRAAGSVTPHLALSTDGLLLPEIALATAGLVQRSCGRPGRVRSMLDIDFRERYPAGKSVDENVLVIGSADVNLATALVLDQTRSYETWGAGFSKPYEHPAILGANGTRYMFTVSPNTGLLALYVNPWTENRRFIIVCAGLYAVGTIAALRLALEYLNGSRTDENSIRSELPMRIVNGVPVRYRNVELKPLSELLPPMDVVNISAIDVRE